ncbi:MAG: O-antigen ligase family protein [Parvularculaceae bacterium]|nr:O-antigen ligase family protein [Parvularculaceae bacterium]
MLYFIKPLIVVLAVSALAFHFSALAFVDSVDRRRLARWRNIFMVITAIGFLTPNFWLMLLFMSIAVLAMGRSEPFKPALYLLLLFALPAADANVPGFAGINNFLRIYPFNVLALLLLAPVMLGGAQIKLRNIKFNMADFCFWSFSLLVVVLAFRDTTMTDGIRSSTDYFLTALPPYLVFSRVHWTLDRLKVATAALVTPLIALSAIGVVEVVMHWHVYNAAVDNWNVRFLGRYLERSGMLRAYASVIGPIAFGVYLMIAVSVTPALIGVAKKKFLARGGLATLVAGLLSSMSRGPWMATVLSVLIQAATTRRPVSNLMRLGFLGLALFPIVAMTPLGAKIIELLPFVGTAETTTIDYRQDLATIGWQVVMQNPLFGSEYYLNTPAMQSLIQGQGIIDIVNTYLQFALDYGLVGMGLFVATQFFALLSLYRAIGPARKISADLGAFCQGYFAALLSTLVVIATTSSVVAQMQEVIWLMCGMSVGVARSVALAREQAKAPKPVEAAPPTGEERAVAHLPGRQKKPPSGNLPPHLRQYARRPS